MRLYIKKDFYKHTKIDVSMKKKLEHKSTKKPSVLSIFLLFFKIGSVGFGGGPAVLSIIQQEVVEKKKWIPQEKYLQGLAISLMPPGSIMVNTAYFVGYWLRGLAGGIAALGGILLPSFIIMILLAAFLYIFKSLNVNQGILSGLAPAVCGVLVAMVYKMSKEHIKHGWGILLMVVSVLLLFYYKVPPYILIVASMILGGGIWLWGNKLKASDKKQKSKV